MSAIIAAEPRHHGGSPRIYSGEDRFSVPKKRRLTECALALGSLKLGDRAFESDPKLRHYARLQELAGSGVVRAGGMPAPLCAGVDSSVIVGVGWIWVVRAGGDASATLLRTFAQQHHIGIHASAQHADIFAVRRILNPGDLVALEIRKLAARGTVERLEP